MLELSRFQMLRPAQTISEEEKSQLGLPLYGTQPLSQFAQQLIGAETAESYGSLNKRFAARNEGSDLVTKTPPAAEVLTLYRWLDYKAKPIRLKDLIAFLPKAKLSGELDLATEWVRLADNYVLSLLDPSLDLACQYDLQLLIRALYVYALCLQKAAGKTEMEPSPAASDALLARLLSARIILPALLLRDRCARKCRSASVQVEQPKVLANLQSTGRKLVCHCECNSDCHPPSAFCICIHPYVADLYIIKEELARYEAGDIADIENILAGETKVRNHRFLSRSEQTDETDQETDTSEERDHQVDEKSALQSEVKKTVDTKVGVDAGVTATLKYGNSITITPHANVTYNQAKNQSSSQAQSYSKDVVDRSVSSLQTKVRSVAISKITIETEERNKDSIDNSAPGSDHRAGIYYWVNRVTHAQVFNYGRHMMFDLIVPEPAALFKALYNLKSSSDQTLEAPVKPVVDINGILSTNYSALLNQFAIATTDDITPPDPEVTVSIALAQNVMPDDGKSMAFSSTDAKVDIPEGYAAFSASYDIRCSTGDPGSTGPNDQVAVSVNLGSHCLLSKSMDEWVASGQIAQYWSANNNNLLMLGETGSLAAAAAGYSSLALSLGGSISIKCKLTPSGLAVWQTKIYNLVMTDYGRKLSAYQSSSGQSTDIVQIKGRNAFLNREIERNEFKRHIISILMCNYFNGIGSMVDHVAPCGYPEIDFGKLSADIPIVQFFEQVFEWDYMTYLFYHSMWARKCKWPELIDSDSGDPLFDKFLMAGASRVQVPIQPGMEHVFLWFLKHSEIWGESGEPPVPGDDDYISMIQELKEADQGDYTDRPGLIAAQQNNNKLQLTNSSFYWDDVNAQPSTLTIANDIDREILVDFKVYRIVSIDDAGAPDHASWTLMIDPPFADPDAVNIKHAVGAVFVGAPWEIVIPTELVYLRNKKDLLPTYPLI